MKSYSYFSYTRVIAVISFVAGILLFWPGKLFFLNDDFIHLELTSQGKWLQQNSFRPVCDLSMWVDYKIWGLNAVGFHLTNSLLHIANSYLVYRFANRLLSRFHIAAIASSNAILIACIFYLYAFHAESVYWVIGRSSSLGALFFLLSINNYLERKDRKRFYLSLLFLGIGLLTYESVWISPLVFAVISTMDIRANAAVPKNERKHLLFAFAVMLVYLTIRFLSIGQFIEAYEGDRFMNFDVKGIFLNYIKLVLRSLSKQSADIYLIIPALLIGLTAFTSFLFTKKKVMVTGIVFVWLATYLPYLSLGIDTFGTEGERYLYLPSIFLCIIIGLGIVNAAKVYKYIISLMFFVIHMLLLYNARSNYQVASEVTRSTVKELKNVSSNAHIYFMCLPEENRGALIFRNGIIQAAKLYADPSNNISVLTNCNIDGNFESFTGVSEEDPSGIKGKSNVQVIFDYSKHSLIVSYLPPGTISE